MASFSPFIRKTSPAMREALAIRLGITLPDAVNWADPGLTFAAAFAKAVDANETAGRAEAAFALERIASMADPVGDVAMESTWAEGTDFPELSGVQDRAIWLFINHPVSFQRAEDARFMDDRRRTRRWEGVVLTSNLTVNQSEERIEAFKKSLSGAVSGGKVKVDIFERTRRGFDGSEYTVVQVTVYAEQKAEVSLEFIGDQVESIARRPVLSAALTYEPQSGAVEVTAKTKDARIALLQEFRTHLLDAETSVSAMQLRRFDLQHLKRPHTFPTDAEDQIAAVALRSLRLMPLGRDDERLTMEIGRNARMSIWETATAQFGERSPLGSGWWVTSATLAVTFHPRGTAKRGKTISMQITQPNGCDLKDRTELEQLIGNKYLKRWEILYDEPQLVVG
jgi:hypothetical protein